MSQTGRVSLATSGSGLSSCRSLLSWCSRRLPGDNGRPGAALTWQAGPPAAPRRPARWRARANERSSHAAGAREVSPEDDPSQTLIGRRFIMAETASSPTLLSPPPALVDLLVPADRIDRCRRSAFVPGVLGRVRGVFGARRAPSAAPGRGPINGRSGAGVGRKWPSGAGIGFVTGRRRRTGPRWWANAEGGRELAVYEGKHKEKLWKAVGAPKFAPPWERLTSVDGYFCRVLDFCFNLTRPCWWDTFSPSSVHLGALM